MLSDMNPGHQKAPEMAAPPAVEDAMVRPLLPSKGALEAPRVTDTFTISSSSIGPHVCRSLRFLHAEGDTAWSQPIYLQLKKNKTAKYF